MDWVEGKSIGYLSPEFAEVFVGRKAFEGLESLGEVIGFEEVVQVRFELVVGSELRSPVDSDEQVELAFGSSHLGQVDVEEADRIGVELLSLGLVAFDIR